MRQLRIGTRGSELALAQAGRVAAWLGEMGHETDLVKILTTGDRLAGPLADQGGKALWVREIQEALLDGTIDLAVHSAKDLPAEPTNGVTIAAYPEREDPRDVFVGAPGRRFASLPPGARVGTGSLRRIALLRSLRPELEAVPLRGNVPTRLAKIETLQLDGVIVAAAGLLRLGLEEHILDPLDTDRFMPAGGQGAIAVEVAVDDEQMVEIVGRLDDSRVAAQVRAERSFLAELGADCHASVAVHASFHGVRLRLRAIVLTPDGQERLEGSAEGDTGTPETLGVSLGRELIQRGARRLIERSG